MTETPQVNLEADEADEEETSQEAPKAQEQRRETVEEQNARLTRELAEARRDAGKTRVNAKEKAAQEREEQIVQTLLKALGRGEDGSKAVSVDELRQQLEASQRETQNLKLRETVRTVAADIPGADASRLLRTTDFAEAVDGIDPTDTDAIKAAIQTTLDSLPWLKVEAQAAPAPRKGKSGTEMSGGTGEGAITQERFDQMSGAERNALFQRDPETYRRLSGND